MKYTSAHEAFAGPEAAAIPDVPGSVLQAAIKDLESLGCTDPTDAQLATAVRRASTARHPEPASTAELLPAYDPALHNDTVIANHRLRFPASKDIRVPARSYMDHDDVQQLAAIALMEGVIKTNSASTHYTLSTHVYKSTKWMFLRELNHTTGSSRLPEHLSSRLIKVNKANRRLAAKGKPPLSQKEAGDLVGVPNNMTSLFNIQTARQLKYHTGSLEDPAEAPGTNGSSEYSGIRPVLGMGVHTNLFTGDTNPEDNAIDAAIGKEGRKDTFAKIYGSAYLNLREQEIIALRFCLRPGTLPRTLESVGKELGITRESVRRIEARALSKMRYAAHLHGLAPNNAL